MGGVVVLGMDKRRRSGLARPVKCVVSLVSSLKANVSVEAEARFGADSLERLVRNHFHRLFIPGLKSLHFLRRIRPRQRPGGSSYIIFERQRSPSRHLWRVVVERLVGPDFFIFRSEREGEGRKWAENAQNRPVRAVRGHFWPIFHHFSVLEPSRGHFCIIFS